MHHPPLAAVDDCDSGITTTGPPTEDASGIGSCGVGTLVREWTVSDCAGNTTTISQNITITDNTPPVFLVPIPADETVQCSGIPPAAELDTQDACDPSVLFSDFPVDDMSGLNACGFGTLLRTWTVTDCSGNTAIDSSASISIAKRKNSPGRLNSRRKILADIQRRI